MTIQTLRGFRDFYPEDQAVITYLRQKIADTCALFGYEEFEGPALESFELYAAKSSEEIVSEQAFVFEDRGGDKITLRPELTPTLARMVAAKQSQLTFPLRWWSFGRFWRYERPQKGRGREFYQWNCDLLGDDSVTSEVEILQVIIRFLSSLGLTPQDCVIELSDRQFITTYLQQQNFSAADTKNVFKVLDKSAKLSADELKTYALKLGLSETQYEQLSALIEADSTTWKQSERLVQILDLLSEEEFAWVRVNLSIVRGFDYYTGVVFEVSDRERQYRAMLGGGRYSNLIEAVGGQPLSAIGFGMGDMVILDYLASKDKLLPTTAKPNVCVISLDPTAQTICTQFATQLRNQNTPCIFYGTTSAIGKSLKFADQKNIKWAALVGTTEVEAGTITLKNLQSGEQATIPLEQALQRLTVNQN